MKHAKCADCHSPDAHKGQFSKRPMGGECAECHGVNGWKPSLFTVAMHAATKYPLEGKHAPVPCAMCHLPKSVDTVFKISKTDCGSCHADIHKGQFLGPPHNNRCEDCHTVQTFHSVRFTPASHEKTRFPLLRAHAAVPCIECHKSDTATFPPGPVKYRSDDRTCTGCHEDPHKGQFSERTTKRRANGSPLGCEACHTLNTWREITGFDHSTTTFPLVGAHRAVACSGCHLPANLRTTLRDVDFKAASHQCKGCHEDAHGGQFSKSPYSRDEDPPDCAICHNSLKWRPSKFDHEKGTTFSLRGAHQEVPCGHCHKLIQEVEGKRVLFYKPTPRECAACHTDNYAGTLPNNCYGCHQKDYNNTATIPGVPNHLTAGMPQDCALCHSTTNWLNAALDHNKTSFPLTGKHADPTVTCAQCHVGGKFVGTPTDCYSCHTPEYKATTNPNHTAAGFPTTCQTCHTTTNWLGATFNHTWFPVPHRSVSVCSDCHNNPNNYAVFYCTNCHTHNKTDTDSHHQGVSGYVYNSPNCYACHPRGTVN